MPKSPLAHRRPGTSQPITIYVDSNEESTLGDTEKVIWSSINHLCARDVAEDTLYDVYGIRNLNRLKTSAENIGLYIRQASEFYDAAINSNSRTAPLHFYYSFLNLAKAICEIGQNRFHRKNEAYTHGISWKADQNYLVDPNFEWVKISTRGVWHVLWESLRGAPCPATNPMKVRVRDLLACCPEIGIEYQRTFDRRDYLIPLLNPKLLFDESSKITWLRFGVDKYELTSRKISRSTFTSWIGRTKSSFKLVESVDDDSWTFEMVRGKSYTKSGDPRLALSPEINHLNLFSNIEDNGVAFSIYDRQRFGIDMPQIIVLYSLIFWLGSIVRYDPHSVAALQDSEYWIIVDGFLNQSRIWLLELMEWQLYQRQTTLTTAR